MVSLTNDLALSVFSQTADPQSQYLQLVLEADRAECSKASDLFLIWLANISVAHWSLGQEHSYGKTQHIPGKQVLVRSIYLFYEVISTTCFSHNFHAPNRMHSSLGFQEVYSHIGKLHYCTAAVKNSIGALFISEIPECKCEKSRNLHIIYLGEHD